MNEAEKRARTAGKRSLDVGGSNDGARRLYKRLGYRVTSRRRGLIYWIVTGDAVVHHMEKSLAEPANVRPPKPLPPPPRSALLPIPATRYH